ncbi:hypothetical protein QE410_001731 [Microbacterium sp. SORGH_AS 1204]|nr:hypothetical protein [Microbacterium sp. SORGH_AS_1204]
MYDTPSSGPGARRVAHERRGCARPGDPPVGEPPPEDLPPGVVRRPAGTTAEVLDDTPSHRHGTRRVVHERRRCARPGDQPPGGCRGPGGHNCGGSRRHAVSPTRHTACRARTPPLCTARGPATGDPAPGVVRRSAGTTAGVLDDTPSHRHDTRRVIHERRRCARPGRTHSRADPPGTAGGGPAGHGRGRPADHGRGQTRRATAGGRTARRPCGTQAFASAASRRSLIRSG